LEVRPAGRGNGKIVKYKKVIYRSYAELARVEGIKPEVLSSRMRKGFSIGQAVRELKARNR
jgi:hypothetical protein